MSFIWHISSNLNIIVIACQSAGLVRGEKSALVAHILGGKEPCVNASAEATMAAKELKQLLNTATSTSKSSVTSHPSTSSTKHGQSASTESSLQSQPKKSKQTSIVSHTFKGIDMPFSSSEIVAVQAQALRAVISANLLFTVFESPKVEKLFWMMRTAAPGIMPSAKVVSGRLLNNADAVVEAKMDKILQSESVGLV